jgi:hypothetical protein
MKKKIPMPKNTKIISKEKKKISIPGLWYYYESFPCHKNTHTIGLHGHVNAH